MDSTVAATAFVSGFSRWYDEGVAGARLARKVESAAESVAAPSEVWAAAPPFEGSID